MKTTTTSMCLSVRGGIKMLQAKRRNGKTYMTDNTGKPLSRDEAIDELMNELSKGREVIPMSLHCGNPCAHASCPGFDFSGVGCGGHITGEEPHSIVIPPMPDQLRDEYDSGLDAVDLHDDWEPEND